MECSPNTVRKYVQSTHTINTQNVVKRLKSRDQRLIGFYIGLWMGDGTQYVDKGSYTVKICCNKKCKDLNLLISKSIEMLFGVRPRLFEETATNRAEVKLWSKFVFDFPRRYVNFQSNNKTSTVQLRNSWHVTSNEFREGCLLGLMLSDGSLLGQLRFHVTSQGLAYDMICLLQYFGFHPRKYMQKRAQKSHKDLHMVWLTRPESRSMNRKLDLILNELGCSIPFTSLKNGGPEEI